MVDCYLLAICDGMAVDQRTNWLSLFNLLDSGVFPRDAHGKPAPLTVAFGFIAPEERDRNKEFEVRLVRRSVDNGLREDGPPIKFRTSNALVTRLFARWFRLPPRDGVYLLTADVRELGAEEWTQCRAMWPFEFRVDPDADAPSPDEVENEDDEDEDVPASL